MGQLKPVQVHRLLNSDGTKELLKEMPAVFSDYARASDLALAADGAIDGRVALRLIQGERAHLGITSESSNPRGD
jgi:hypothetical protein